jgi:hypothetical protein
MLPPIAFGRQLQMLCHGAITAVHAAEISARRQILPGASRHPVKSAGSNLQQMRKSYR